MARSSKPRKAYCPGKVLPGGHLPIPAETQERKELIVLMCLTGMVEGFLTHAMAVELALFVASCSKLPDPEGVLPPLVLPATRVLCSVHDRFTRTGKWGVTGDELKALRPSVVSLLAVYLGQRSSVAADASLSAERIFAKKV